jgi:type IV secretory pathway VirB2 component (pilin)
VIEHSVATKAANQPIPDPSRHDTGTLRPRIGPPWAIAALLAFYFICVALMATQTECGNDYSGFFMPSARFILAGKPLDMYQVRAQGNVIYPNANGPVSEFAIAGALYVGRALGLQHVNPSCVVSDPYPLPQDSIPLHIWVIMLFAIIPLGIGAEILRLADRWQPEPFTGLQRVVVWVLILFNPPLWDGMIFYGHYEQPLAIWLGLLGVRFVQSERYALSGALLSLSVLSRASSAFIIIPLAVIILVERRWWGALRFGVALAVVTGAILLPFYVHDKYDLLYSLSGFRQYLGIGDGSFWTFFRGTIYEKQVQTWDSTVGLILSGVFSLALILVGRVRRGDPALYAVIAASVICFPLSIKAIWGYYFADPLIWVLAWLVTRPVLRQRVWEPLFMLIVFTTLMVLTEYRINVAQPGPLATGLKRTLVVLESGTEAVVLLLCVVLLGVGLAFGRRHLTALRQPAAPPTPTSGDMMGKLPPILAR